VTQPNQFLVRLRELNVTILAVRHAESQKNVDLKHGGSGEPLSSDGKESLSRISESVRLRLEKSLPLKTIATSPATHSVQTAKALGVDFDFPIEVLDDLSGIDLGQVAGLTQIEISLYFPQITQIFADWTEGKIPISNLELPEMESPPDFADRILNAFDKLLEPNSTIIFVATRSTMILLWNLKIQQEEFSFERYVGRDFGNGEILTLGYG